MGTSLGYYTPKDAIATGPLGLPKYYVVVLCPSCSGAGEHWLGKGKWKTCGVCAGHRFVKIDPDRLPILEGPDPAQGASS